MLVPHLHLNGRCEEAISLYVKAFDARVIYIQRRSEHEPQKGVVHAEIYIHNQKLMLNDFGGNSDFSNLGAYQLVIIFDNEVDLKRAYSVMQEGSNTIFPMRKTDFSPCTVGFFDKFGVRWGFMV